MTPDRTSPLADLDRLLIALADVGAAVLLATPDGRVAGMNRAAEGLTGWPAAEAVGRPVGDVYRAADERTGRPVPDLIAAVLATGAAVGLTDHAVLVARDGTERPLDHGAAPVRDAAGAVAGAVLVFSDVGDRERSVQAIEDARSFAEEIVHTVREPLVVLDPDLTVRSANRSFYRTFAVAPEDTEGRSLFALGGGQWDVPELRQLLEVVLPRDSGFAGFEVDHEFDRIGRRVMVLNARRLPPGARRPALILLAIEDATDRARAAEALATSEVRYRRLFETAQDGILLVDPDTRRIFDANPFLADMLGYSRDELIGRELWEIGLFRDIESSKAAFRTLQEKGYIRYEDLPLRTRDDRAIEVEFVSNVYPVGDARVIQCNIRDVTDRKRAEYALRAAHAGLEDRVRERTAELTAANDALAAEIARREGAEADGRDLRRRLATAQEDERRRIALELHDQIGQHLIALGLGLKVVRDAAPGPSDAGDRLRSLQELTDRIGRDVHDLALELRPPALDDLGLHDALTNYAEGWAGRARVEVDVHAPGADAPRLPPAVETALYRIAQEALANVARHAAARRVSLTLRRTRDQVRMVVEDDGRGFDPDAGPARGRLGLFGMQERAGLVGGTVTVESGPGRGTAVVVLVPLPQAEGGDG